MSADGCVYTSSHGNQPFVYSLEPCRRKLCCSLRRNSTAQTSKTACGSSARHYCATSRKTTLEQGPQVADQPVLDSREPQLPRHEGTSALLLALSLAVGNTLLQCAPAIAFTIHQEPENALSFPTWVIHISSVIEWAIAMSLVWKYAEVTGTAYDNVCAFVLI